MLDKKNFYYDIVFCIDKTKEMSNWSYFLNDFISRFYELSKQKIQNPIRKVAGLRIKIVEFGDYNTCENAIIDHGFLTMPDDDAKLFEILDGLTYDAESQTQGLSCGFEALYKAFSSEWIDLSEEAGRQSVVLFSCNSPTNIEDTRNIECYPTDFPKNLFELKEYWENNKGLLKDDKKMLSIFAPISRDKNSWKPLQRWQNVIAVETMNIDDYDFDFIFETILIDLI